MYMGCDEGAQQVNLVKEKKNDSLLSIWLIVGLCDKLKLKNKFHCQFFFTLIAPLKWYSDRVQT